MFRRGLARLGGVIRGSAAAVFAVLAAAPQTAQAEGGAGKLLRAQPLYGAPEGATAYRVAYQSTGLPGFVAFKASDAAVAWIAERRAPSNCGAI